MHLRPAYLSRALAPLLPAKLSAKEGLYHSFPQRRRSSALRLVRSKTQNPKKKKTTMNIKVMASALALRTTRTLCLANPRAFSRTGRQENSRLCAPWEVERGEHRRRVAGGVLRTRVKKVMGRGLGSHWWGRVALQLRSPAVTVPIELIPRINRQNGGRERSDSVGSMDTVTLLKDTEAVMAFLEAKLRDEKKLDPVTPQACPLSPESDIDTASTVSQAAAEGDRKAVQKRRSLSSLYREKSNASTISKTTTSARERLERKTKTKTTESRSDTRRSVQTSSRGRQLSQDLTDDDQTSSLAISDILSSDQEMYSSRSLTKGHFTSTDDLLQSKLDTSKSTRSAKPSKTLQTSTSTAALAKQAGLPQPRPTRAYLLRRARLGDTSDTDLADADRVSVASEVSTTSSTSKPPSGRKAQSRIDMLAQPRRTRLGSVSARSDSEATVSRTTTTRLSAETALRLGLRSTNQQAPDSKLTARMRANSVSKLTDPKPKTAPVNSAPSGEKDSLLLCNSNINILIAALCLEMLLSRCGKQKWGNLPIWDKETDQYCVYVVWQLTSHVNKFISIRIRYII